VIKISVPVSASFSARRFRGLRASAVHHRHIGKVEYEHAGASDPFERTAHSGGGSEEESAADPVDYDVAIRERSRIIGSVSE